MSVELAAAFPVLIAIAVIATNAVLFFSECAAFDNAFREAVRTYATSPAYEQGLDESRALVESALQERFTQDFEQASIGVEGVAGGHVEFTGTLSLQPTLFGMGLRSSVFGVSLPSITHRISYAVDTYKPGVFF